MGRPGDGAFRTACDNPMMRRRVHHELALAVVAVLVMACGSPNPSASTAQSPSVAPSTGPTATPGTPAPTLSNDQVVAAIETSVQQIRELTKKSDVSQKVLTPAQ